MSAEIKAALLCDQVRTEDNGKLLIIGAYTGFPRFANFPVVAQFAVVARVELNGPGPHDMHLRFKVGNEVVGDVEGTLDSEERLEGLNGEWVHIPLPPLQLEGPVQMWLEQDKGDQRWEPVTMFDFQPM